METVIRGAVVLILVLVVSSPAGRRPQAQLTTFDIVLVLLVGPTTQQALLGDDFSIVNAVILIITLFSLDILLSYFKEHSPRAERLLDGVPTVLISLGKPDARALKRARVAIEDVLESARAQHGIERLDQIKFAVLEVGGDISIVPAQ